MSYSVRVSRRAGAYLKRLDPTTQDRFLARLGELADDPFQHSKPLTNSAGSRSSRVGGWRIIFRVDVERQTIDVDAIAPRGQVYRDL